MSAAAGWVWSGKGGLRSTRTTISHALCRIWGVSAGGYITTTLMPLCRIWGMGVYSECLVGASVRLRDSTFLCLVSVFEGSIDFSSLATIVMPYLGSGIDHKQEDRAECFLCDWLRPRRRLLHQ